jgi:hypothetical protein
MCDAIPFPDRRIDAVGPLSLAGILQRAHERYKRGKMLSRMTNTSANSAKVVQGNHVIVFGPTF